MLASVDGLFFIRVEISLVVGMTTDFLLNPGHFCIVLKETDFT